MGIIAKIASMLDAAEKLGAADYEFVFYSLLSAAVIAVTVLFTVCIYPFRKKLQRYVSRLNVMTFAVFIAAWLLFYPICGQWRVWADAASVPSDAMRTILAARSALRLFLIDLDFDMVLTGTKDKLGDMRQIFLYYAAFIYMAAPVLTFTNLLSLFRDVIRELRVRFCRRRIYVLSELNPHSVSLAKDIRYRRFFSMIVFADVFPGDKEEDYELLQQARSIHAICLKRDAANIELARIGRPVEFLLVGNNENENTSQAIALTKKYKNKWRVTSIYTFDSAPSTDHILDSLDKGKHLLSLCLICRLLLNPKQLLRRDTWERKHRRVSGSFSLRRIDPVDLLVQEVLTWDSYADYRRIWEEADKNSKTVSITILGMGRYGTEFLKTAVWFYQRYGHKVEFNVIDQGDVNGDAEKRLRHECPELLGNYTDNSSTEAFYDIKFFHGIDCFSSDFDQMLEDNRERFQRTQMVFIALGDDERDIRAAINARSIFDRMYLNERKADASGSPLIYTVIYDDQRARNLNSNTREEKNPLIRLLRKLSGREEKPTVGLVNHKKIPYDIRFVGALTDRYSFDAIQRFKQREVRAVQYHLEWVRKETELRSCYEQDPNRPAADEQWCAEFRKVLDAEVEASKKPLTWADAYLYPTGADGKPDFSGPINAAGLRESIEQYMRFSYFRKSSLSKEFQKTAMKHLHPDGAGNVDVCSNPVCGCSRCRELRITEHMRWNAYMRAQGYRYNATRDDRAMLHHNLVTWDALPCRDRFKD